MIWLISIYIISAVVALWLDIKDFKEDTPLPEPTFGDYYELCPPLVWSCIIPAVNTVTATVLILKFLWNKLEKVKL